MRILSLNKKKLHGGVAHCFADDAETAKKLIDLGFYISIGGAILHDENDVSKQLCDAVAAIPISRIVIETDAPYVAPGFTVDTLSKKQKRKVRNTSPILPAVIEKIAEIKGIDRDTCENIIY